MIAISSRRNLSQELLPRHQAPWPDFGLLPVRSGCWCRYLRHVDRRTNASEGRSTKVVQGTKTHQQLNDLEVNCMPCLIVVERRCSTRAMPTQAAACRFEHRTRSKLAAAAGLTHVARPGVPALAARNAPAPAAGGLLRVETVLAPAGHGVHTTGCFAACALVGVRRPGGPFLGEDLQCRAKYDLVHRADLCMVGFGMSWVQQKP